MSKKHIQVYRVLNYILSTYFFLVSTVSGCVSISAFASLVGIPLLFESVKALGIKISSLFNLDFANYNILSYLFSTFF